ncbi:AAA family ATPase [Pseudomaricurvus alcaniphilus]|uniref:gluconokinase n=1 Tax=Pseudomaricurvus alcaniphilus TaxID=1166482 RepID=UPI00140E00A9|nr:gluconokinase, GntK/IdnK-type [Pseudomaricurvus alcaniphilus]NHN37885.1 AAA family ATPase [Pseudomaricurvus alcaniphilus]
MLIVVCGVSGTGKSTVGKLLATALDLSFYDADDFHPESNIAKMKAGIALDDKDRQPWLETLALKLSAWQGSSGAVLACSALKEAYRVILASHCSEPIKWVFLHGSEALLTERLASRQGHFFDVRLLSSQLDALELPDYGWVIDVQPAPAGIVETILAKLNSPAADS